MRTKDAETVGEALETAFREGGLPLPYVITSDGGTEFNNSTVSSIQSVQLGVTPETTPAGRHQSNSPVERALRDFVDILAATMTDKGIPPSKFYEAVPLATLRYNNKPRKADNLSPFQRLFHVSPPIPALKRLEELEHGTDAQLVDVYPVGTRVLYKAPDDKKIRGRQKKHKLSANWSTGVVKKIISPHIRLVKWETGSKRKKNRPSQVHIFNLKTEGLPENTFPSTDDSSEQTDTDDTPTNNADTPLSPSSQQTEDQQINSTPPSTPPSQDAELNEMTSEPSPLLAASAPSPSATQENPHDTPDSSQPTAAEDDDNDELATFERLTAPLNLSDLNVDDVIIFAENSFVFPGKIRKIENDNLLLQPFQKLPSGKYFPMWISTSSNKTKCMKEQPPKHKPFIISVSLQFTVSSMFFKDGQIFGLKHPLYEHAGVNKSPVSPQSSSFMCIEVTNNSDLSDSSYFPPHASKSDLPHSIHSFYAGTTSQKIRIRDLTAPERARVYEAQAAELARFKEFDAFERVPINEVHPSIPRFRTYLHNVIKHNLVEKTSKYKSRLVVDGKNDHRKLTEDVSTKNTNHAEVRILHHLAASFPEYSPSKSFTADAINGYLQAIDSGSALIPPEDHNDHGSYLWVVKRAIYGIPRAGILFEKHFNAALLKDGWTEMPGMTGSWVLRPDSKLSPIAYLAKFVDDTFTLPVRGDKNEVRDRLTSLLKLTVDESSPVHFVGVTYDHTNGVSHQHDYINSIPSDNPTPVEHPTPLPINPSLLARHRAAPLSKQDHHHYRTLVGKLNFVAQNTRPDIASAVSDLSSHLHNPTDYDSHLVQRAIEYTKATQSLIPLPTTHNPHLRVDCFVDASLGSDQRPHPKSGFLICINGLPVIWSSKVQTRSTVGPTKAELVAITEAADRLELLKHIVDSQGIPIEMHMHTDAQDCIDLLAVNNPRPAEVSMLPLIQQLKTMGIRAVHLFAARDYLNAALVQLHKIDGTDNPSDCLTKSTSCTPLRQYLPLAPLPPPSQAGDNKSSIKSV